MVAASKREGHVRLQGRIAVQRRTLGPRDDTVSCVRAREPGGGEVLLRVRDADGRDGRCIREERKVVTVAFVDLVGFTSGRSSSTPRTFEGCSLLTTHACARARASRRYRGEVHRRRGDGGVRRARHARGRPRAGSTRRARDPGLGLRGGRSAELRLGINTGEALVTLTASEGEGFVRGRGQHCGSPAAAAPVNGILVGSRPGARPRTRSRTRRRCRSSRRGRLRRFRRGSRAGPRPLRRGRPPHRLAPLVGRQRELDLLASSTRRGCARSARRSS